VFGWDFAPRSWDDLQGGRLSLLFGVKGHLGIFLFAAITWSLWKTRNKMAIVQIFPINPIDVLFSAVMLMQK